VPDTEKAQRLQRLLAVQESILSARNAALLGRRFEVLADGPSRLDTSMSRGRTRCNRIVHFPADTPTRGGFLDVTITRAHAHSLTGEPARNAPVA
jgi:tRNA-2-methylthio-N6-dimethylallyladenosine synthase